MAKTQLHPTAIPGRPYGSFLDKATQDPKSSGPFTTLTPLGWPGRRYGNFGSKDVGTQIGQITGDVTTTLNIVATLDQTPREIIDGDVTTTFGVGATLDYTSLASFSTESDVTTSIIPSAAAMNFGGQVAITGDVTLTFDPTATIDYTKNSSVQGDIDLTLTPSGTFAQAANYDVTGDIDLTMGVAASDLTQTIVGTNRSITGDVTLQFFTFAVFNGGTEQGNRRRRTNFNIGRLGRR